VKKQLIKASDSAVIEVGTTVTSTVIQALKDTSSPHEAKMEHWDQRFSSPF
jgi:hypothetical protein